jgi:hypothetical protein
VSRPALTQGQHAIVTCFAKALFERLEADHWGDIEPEVFRNIGEGLTGDEPDDVIDDRMLSGKLSRREMLDAIDGMRLALRDAFEEVLKL